MDQLTKLLAGLSARQKISILLAAILTVGGMVGFIHWKRESDFRPLYTSMAPEDAAGVVQKLRETGVEYRLSESGTAVLVPSAKLGESRIALAAAGLPKTGRIGFELFDKSSFGATEFVEHINYKRALEGELERSVMSLAEVEEARVHLTLPRESIFLENQQPAKASVMLKLRAGSPIVPQNVQAISNLVASAVEGLAPEAVSIVDMNGNLLNRPRRAGDADGAQMTSEALEVRQQIERDLISKIHSTVDPVVGPDRIRAGASVECDLTSGEQQEETYDPSRSVMVTSQKTEDSAGRLGTAASGVPGTAANLPGAAQPAPAGSAGSRRTENVTFQSSRVIRHTRIPQGVIRRMSLSVLVDNTVRWEGGGKARKRVLEPPAPETLKTIRDLVAATTGFNTERGDQLIVESLPFESSRNAEPPPLSTAWPARPEGQGQQLLDLVKGHRLELLAATAGIALVLFVLRIAVGFVFRRKRHTGIVVPPALAEGSGPMVPDALERAVAAALPSAPETNAAGNGEPADVVTRVRRLAQADAGTAANVLRAWLQESEAQS